MSKRTLTLGLVLVAGALVVLEATSADGRGRRRARDRGEVEWSEAEIFFELNNTDGDLGIHSSIDGEPWKHLEIEAPSGRELLDIRVKSRLRRQGLTQLFFESAEPPFDELDPETFFRRFPEGSYEVEGKTLEGPDLESETELTHLLPAPPSGITVSGLPVPEDCDEGPVPVASRDEPVVVRWDAVTQSHPELGRTDEPIEVVRYQVVVEEEESGLILSVELPPDVLELEVPPSFVALGESFKLEILVRESSSNQTAVETCFAVE